MDLGATESTVELGAAALVDEQGAAELMLVIGAPQHVVDLGAAKLICIFSWISGSHEKLRAAELLLGLESERLFSWWMNLGEEARSFEPHGGAWCGGAHDGTWGSGAGSGARSGRVAELVVELGEKEPVLDLEARGRGAHCGKLMA